MLTTAQLPTATHPSDRLFRGEATNFAEAIALRIAAINREIQIAESRQPVSQMSRQNLIGLLWQYREEKLCQTLFRQYHHAATSSDALQKVLDKWRSHQHTRWYAEVAESGNYKELAI